MGNDFRIVKSLVIFISLSIFTLSTRDGICVGGKRISVRLAHSVCTQYDQFKQTQEIQPAALFPPNSNLPSKLPCGWISLKSCGSSQGPQLCSFSEPRFLTCDKAKTRKRPRKSGRSPAFPAQAAIRHAKTQQRKMEAEMEKLYPVFKYLGVGFPDGKTFFITSGERKAKDVLLPRSVTPQHYDIFIRPILQSSPDPELPWPYLACPGSVRILLDINEETKRISVHRAERMTIDYVKVTQTSNDEEVPIAQQSYNKTEELQHFDLKRALSDLGEGTYELVINFTALISNDPAGPKRGFYEGKYEDKNGEINNFAVTQFEDNFARMAFPCFDQPQFKSTFSVSIARTADYNSRSNGPKTETVDDPENSGWFIDRFEKTMKMSSYLVAFLISDFTCEAAPSSIFDKPVQLCGQPDLIAQGFAKFQANGSAHILKTLETKYKFPYEMSKVDQVALPPGYRRGGMENWGLIAYEEASVLIFDPEPTQLGIGTLLKLTSHELAHSWFGNLVTCKTWEDLWLNEALTTFAQQIEDKTNPEFFSGTRILLSVAGTLFDLNEQTPIAGPESDLTNNVYLKGGSLLLWSESILGDDLMAEALVEYLQKYAYGSVATDDFTALLDEFVQKENRLPSGKTMKIFLDSFVLQPGHPLVRVKVESETDGGSGTTVTTVSLTQEKYLFAESGKPFEYLWEFPIKLISDETPSIDNRPTDLWMSGPKITTSITIGPESWYIFNADGLGFYRILYDDQLFNLVLVQLEKDHTVINSNARARLLVDHLSFFERGFAPVEQSLSMTKYMRSEVDSVVWKSLFSVIEFMEKLLFSRAEYKDYWSPRLENLINHLDIEKQGDRGFEAIFKADIFKRAVKYRIPSFTKRSSTLVQTWAANARENPKYPFQVDYRPSIFCAAVTDPENSQFEVLFQMVKDNPELTDLLVALGCSQNPDQVQSVLKYVLENTSVDGAQADLLYNGVAVNELMGSVLLQFWDQRFTEVANKISISEIISVTTSLSKSIVKEEERDELLEFVENHRTEFGEAKDGLSKTIRGIFDSNAKFMEELGSQALKWFQENS